MATTSPRTSIPRPLRVAFFLIVLFFVSLQIENQNFYVQATVELDIMAKLMKTTVQEQWKTAVKERFTSNTSFAKNWIANTFTFANNIKEYSQSTCGAAMHPVTAVVVSIINAFGDAADAKEMEKATGVSLETAKQFFEFAATVFKLPPPASDEIVCWRRNMFKQLCVEACHDKGMYYSHNEPGYTRCYCKCYASDSAKDPCTSAGNVCFANKPTYYKNSFCNAPWPWSTDDDSLTKFENFFTNYHTQIAAQIGDAYEQEKKYVEEAKKEYTSYTIALIDAMEKNDAYDDTDMPENSPST